MDLILLLLLNIAYFFNIAHSIKCLDWYLYCSNTFTTTELISAHVANNCFFVNSKYSLPISSLIYLIKTFNNISIWVQRFKITINFALIYQYLLKYIPVIQLLQHCSTINIMYVSCWLGSLYHYYSLESLRKEMEHCRAFLSTTGNWFITYRLIYYKQ